jgi:hypothetical protein
VNEEGRIVQGPGTPQLLRPSSTGTRRSARRAGTAGRRGPHTRGHAGALATALALTACQVAGSENDGPATRPASSEELVTATTCRSVACIERPPLPGSDDVAEAQKSQDCWVSDSTGLEYRVNGLRDEAQCLAHLRPLESVVGYSITVTYCGDGHSARTCTLEVTGSRSEPSDGQDSAAAGDSPPPPQSSGPQLPGDFSPENYGAHNVDVLAALGPSPAAMSQHSLAHGITEGRCYRCFDALRYVASYGDLVAAFGENAAAATSHFFHHGFREGRSLRFDCARYGQLNPDVAAAFAGSCLEMTLHYIRDGHREGRATGY